MISTILLAVIYVAFISLGLPDGAFGVAWPSMRSDFAMPLQMAGLVSIILTFCSAFSSFMNGTILRRFGTGRITLLSCLMTGLALLGHSVAPSFLWLIVFAIPLGFGQGAVDSGLNNYVANNYSSRHMNWLHCFWGVGAMLGPLIMTKTLALDKSWRSGYSTIAFIQIGLAFIFLMSLKLWKSESNSTEAESKTQEKNGNSSFKSIAPWLGILLFFIYCGIEAAVGLWAYSMFVESRNIPKETAGFWISYYYGALMVGRFITGIIVNKLGNRVLIRVGIIVSITGVLLLFIPTIPIITMIGIVLIGFGLAPIYPCMMHEVPNRFDKETSRVLIGYQVSAAYIGGSVLPAGLGLLFSKTTLEALVPCLVIFLISMIIVSEWQNRTT